MLKVIISYTSKMDIEHFRTNITTWRYCTDLTPNCQEIVKKKSSRFSTIFNVYFIKGRLHYPVMGACWLWDLTFCRGKNINRATVYILTVWLFYFYQTRTQCPLKCAKGTLMNVQQRNKSRFTVQETFS